MEEFEKKALATSTLKPESWFRYVDETLSSWAHGLENLHRFLEHINILHPIKFTLGAIHLVRTHRRGGGGMIAAYISVQGGRGVTSASVRTQNKFL